MEDYKELSKDWSDVDKEWLEKHVAEHFRPTAAKHGRFCFNVVMQVGLATGACQAIIGLSQQYNPRFQQQVASAVQTLANILNDLTGYAANSKGVTGEMLQACKTDIERVGALSMATPQNQGRIILPS